MEYWSIGKATDFNLMTKGNVNGHMLHLGFETENTKTVNFNVKLKRLYFIFILANCKYAIKL